MPEVLAEKFQSLFNTVKDIKNPLLIIHPHPDADALGSVFALADFLKKEKINNFKIFCIDQAGKNMAELFPLKEISHSFEISEHDALIFLDRGDVYYKLGFDKKAEGYPGKIKIINIDHHPHTFIPRAINIIDTQASATCEILYRFFDFFGFEIKPKTAQYLINGIYADTGGFRHNNTTSQALEICANLMRKGATLSKPNRQLFAKKSLHTLKLWAIALERAKINPKTGMVVSFITKQDLEKYGADENEISGISEILNTIADSNFSLVLSEREKNKIRASLRSEEYKGIDVSKIARQFKGGGHKLASGFEIKGRLKQVGDSWIIE
jgi:phosphoesterase RecJ-like protein